MQENIEIIVKGKTDPSLKAAERDISNVGTAAENTTKSLDELVDTQGKAATSSSKVGREASKSAGGIASSGNAANKASTFFSKLGQSFKRIFLYRTIRKVISEIGQAAREGIGNLYDYSAALGSMDSTHAKTNMDSLATSALYVKNSIGAMLGPVIQAITPIVYQLADAFAVAANAVNQLFAALVGNSTFTKAVRFPTQMKKGLSGASAAAKELRRTLLGFDEVNRLDMETPSGGGGGASALDMEGMFDEAVVSKKFEKLAEIVKKLAPIVAAVGAAFYTWKIGSKLFSGIKTVATLVGGLNPVFLAVAVAIGLIVAAFVDAYKKNEDFRTGCQAAWEGLKIVFRTVWQVLKDVANVIKAMIPDFVIQKFKNWGDTILNAIPGINLLYNAIKTFGATINASGMTVEQWALKVKGVLAGWRKNFIQEMAQVEREINELLTPLRNLAKVIDSIFGTNYAVNFQLTGAERVNALANQTGGGYQKTGAGGRITVQRTQRFASGGFPTTGELFIARENGIPEMVGQIGGQTAVANNDQIVTAIKQGVVEAMSQSGQNITLNVDGKSLFDIIVNRNNSQVRQTGKSPILV